MTLRVRVESSLDISNVLYNSPVMVPATGLLQTTNVSLPAGLLPKGGHSVFAEIMQGSQVVSEMREYFYVADSPLDVAALYGKYNLE
jgi:hypothetical protein